MFIPESRVPLSLRIHLGATPGQLYLNDAMLPYHHIAMYLLRDTGIIGGLQGLCPQGLNR